MTQLKDYCDRYPSIRMEREEGILSLAFHTAGGPLQWSVAIHAEFADAFNDIARDTENRVMIVTGTGDLFSGPRAATNPIIVTDVLEWDHIMRVGNRMLTTFLDIEALVITCINGPALRHVEIPLLGDIVLAAEDSYLQDSAHFINNRIPGDGVNLVMSELMGLNRAKYFLLTGQQLSANEAKDLGLVNELMPRAQLRDRALQLARQLNRQNPIIQRGTRRLFTERLRQVMQRSLAYGIAVEGFGALETGRSAPEARP
jgi:enoyl-CoA hydratase/carnithine racemase